MQKNPSFEQTEKYEKKTIKNFKSEIPWAFLNVAHPIFMDKFRGLCGYFKSFVDIFGYFEL